MNPLRRGVVTEIKHSGLVVVALEDMPSCGACDHLSEQSTQSPPTHAIDVQSHAPQSNGCGMRLLPTVLAPIEVVCSNPLNTLQCGERVHVELASASTAWLKVVFCAYGIPTLSTLMGAISGNFLSQFSDFSLSSDSFEIIGAILGLAGGLFAWHLLQRRFNSGGIQHSDTVQGHVVAADTASGRLSVMRKVPL